MFWTRTLLMVFFTTSLVACHGTRPIGDDKVTWLPDGTFIWGDDVRSSDAFEPGAKILTRGKYRIVSSTIPLQDLRKKSVLRKHLANGDVVAELVDEKHVKAVGSTGIEQVGTLAGGTGAVMLGTAAIDGKLGTRVSNVAKGGNADAKAGAGNKVSVNADATAIVDKSDDWRD